MSAIDQLGGVLHAESCEVSLDYAYYHVVWNLALVVLLVRTARTEHFLCAHLFGLFALWIDYGVFYLTQETRTVSYGEGVTPLGPLGTFLFFAWFDHFGAWGLIVWARTCEDAIRAWREKLRPISKVDVFVLLHQPLLFWSAPWIASTATRGFDPRVLSVARPSPKRTYAVMLSVCVIALRWGYRMEWRERIVPILVAGFGCGLIHHAALFTFGLRGYTSASGLAKTLTTEWPALVAATAVLRAAFGGERRVHAVGASRLFQASLCVALSASVWPHLNSVEHYVSQLIPTIPGQHMQSVGTAYIRMSTCIAPRVLARLPHALDPRALRLDCWGRGAGVPPRGMLILGSAAKSGAVLSARLAIELGGACGVCVASPERARTGITFGHLPIETLPVYRGEMLLAIVNMLNWPEYVQRHRETLHEAPRCAAMVRDPLSRLRSLYLYARSGGEHYFRYPQPGSNSSTMETLLDADRRGGLDASLALFWAKHGRAYLEQSHAYTLFNVKSHRCAPLAMESFSRNFNGTVLALLDAWGVVPDATIRDELVARASRHDIHGSAGVALSRDPHVTSSTFGEEMAVRVERRLMESVAGVRAVVEQQRAELAPSPKPTHGSSRGSRPVSASNSPGGSLLLSRAPQVPDIDSSDDESSDDLDVGSDDGGWEVGRTTGLAIAAGLAVAASRAAAPPSIVRESFPAQSRLTPPRALSDVFEGSITPPPRSRAQVAEADAAQTGHAAELERLEALHAVAARDAETNIAQLEASAASVAAELRERIAALDTEHRDAARDAEATITRLKRKLHATVTASASALAAQQESSVVQVDALRAESEEATRELAAHARAARSAVKMLSAEVGAEFDASFAAADIEDGAVDIERAAAAASALLTHTLQESATHATERDAAAALNASLQSANLLLQSADGRAAEEARRREGALQAQLEAKSVALADAEAASLAALLAAAEASAEALASAERDAAASLVALEKSSSSALEAAQQRAEALCEERDDAIAANENMEEIVAAAERSAQMSESQVGVTEAMVAKIRTELESEKAAVAAGDAEGIDRNERHAAEIAALGEEYSTGLKEAASAAAAASASGCEAADAAVEAARVEREVALARLREECAEAERKSVVAATAEGKSELAAAELAARSAVAVLRETINLAEYDDAEADDAAVVGSSTAAAYELEKLVGAASEALRHEGEQRALLRVELDAAVTKASRLKMKLEEAVATAAQSAREVAELTDDVHAAVAHSESRDVEAMEEALAREHRDEQFQSELAHASARSTEELLLVRETSQRELVEIATQLREMTEEKERIVLEKEASLVAHQTVVTEHESQVRAAAARGAEEAQKLRFEQETLAASLNEVQVALEKAESEVQRSAASRSEEEISTIAIRAELFESEEKRTLEDDASKRLIGEIERVRDTLKSELESSNTARDALEKMLETKRNDDGSVQRALRELRVKLQQKEDELEAAKETTTSMETLNRDLQLQVSEVERKLRTMRQHRAEYNRASKRAADEDDVERVFSASTMVDAAAEAEGGGDSKQSQQFHELQLRHVEVAAAEEADEGDEQEAPVVGRRSVNELVSHFHRKAGVSENGRQNKTPPRKGSSSSRSGTPRTPVATVAVAIATPAVLERSASESVASALLELNERRRRGEIDEAMLAQLAKEMMRRAVGLPEREDSPRTTQRKVMAHVAAATKAAQPGGHQLTAKVAALRGNLSKLRKKHAKLKAATPIDRDALDAVTNTYKRRKAALKALQGHLSAPPPNALG